MVDVLKKMTNISVGSTVSEVKEYLLDRGIPEKVAEDFYRNKICGQAFFNLTEDDLKELVPLIGIRAKLREMVKKVKKL